MVGGIDSRRGLPGRGASVIIDGTARRIDYGLTLSHDASVTLNDFALQKSGFRGTLHLEGLALGQHRIGFSILDDDAHTQEPWPHELKVTIVSANALKTHIL